MESDTLSSQTNHLPLAEGFIYAEVTQQDIFRKRLIVVDVHVLGSRLSISRVLLQDRLNKLLSYVSTTFDHRIGWTSVQAWEEYLVLFLSVPPIYVAVVCRIFNDWDFAGGVVTTLLLDCMRVLIFRSAKMSITLWENSMFHRVVISMAGILLAPLVDHLQVDLFNSWLLFPLYLWLVDCAVATIIAHYGLLNVIYYLFFAYLSLYPVGRMVSYNHRK
jgi:hypothetical protein